MKGSIEKRGKDSYRLVCTAGYDLNRKLIRYQLIEPLGLGF